jgi:putative phosphoesterase
MKVGVVSDSHDNVPKVSKAIDLLKSQGIQMLIHLGDYVSPFSLRPILEAGLEFIGVFGNNDGDKLALQRVSKGQILDSPRIELIYGKRVFLSHQLPYFEALGKSGEFDLILFGHTHEPYLKRGSGCLILNPGELGGWLYGRTSMAIVDLDKMDAEIIDV